MAAGELDFTIEQGAVFERTITIRDSGVVRDLTGYDARMQIRSAYSSTTTILSLTTENGRITIDEDANTISLFISAEDTEDLSFSAARYDLELIRPSDDEIERLLAGNVTLSLEVTK